MTAVAVAEGRVVSGSVDETLRVWPGLGEHCSVLEGHTHWVTAVAVAEGRVVSSSADETLRVWDLASGQCLHVLKGHTDEVMAVAVAEGRVVSGSRDQRCGCGTWPLGSASTSSKATLTG